MFRTVPMLPEPMKMSRCCLGRSWTCLEGSCSCLGGSWALSRGVLSLLGWFLGLSEERPPATGLDLSQLVATSRNLSQLVATSRNLSELVGTSRNLSQLVATSRNSCSLKGMTLGSYISKSGACRPDPSGIRDGPADLTHSTAEGVGGFEV